MLEGQLFWDEEKDIWTLDIGEREVNISNLIYGIAELGSFFPDFDGEGERIKISLEVMK